MLRRIGSRGKLVRSHYRLCGCLRRLDQDSSTFGLEYADLAEG